MAGEIIFGDQRGGCMSFDRLDGPRMLLGLMAFKRQLVFKRHVDRAVEIGVERLFARGLHGFDGILTGVGRLVMVELEILVQRGRHFMIDRKVIFDRRDIERTGDGVVEIIVESDFRLWGGLRLRLETLRCEMRLWRDFRLRGEVRFWSELRLRCA
ncbi:hypothetical protein, partial [Mesorhizobium sp.]|uniref:hypothetical protein n=1 Tax=Mesorhizobium sp. TaxID=1871066 RepID=UPI0025BB119C